MGAYEYRALDRRGKETRGVLQGDTARQVRQLLREQGLNPLRVDAVTEQGAGRAFLPGRGLSTVELALIIRQLAGLIGAGLPLEEALATTADQSEKTGSRRILVGLRSRVMEGHALSAAMADFPRAFPPLIRATIAAGEQSGRLESVLVRLADYAEQREAFGRRTSLALLYPVLLTLVALAIVGGLLAYVVPQITGVFEGFGARLPALTRALLAISGFLQAYGWLLAIALLLTALGTWFALRVPAFRYERDRLLLRLPVVGRLYRSAETARFVRTLSILVGSAVPLLDALGIAGQVARNGVIRRAIEEAAGRVREGTSLNRALAATGRFPPLVVRLIAGGEKSGNLDEVLERAADIEERAVETAMAVFMTVLEPLLILVVGGMVLVIVLAILLPIFQLNQLIR